MRDPFGQAPQFLQSWARPLAEPPLNLKTLPLHIHEVLGAWLFYTVLSYIVSPILSQAWFSQTYPNLSRRTQSSWHVHAVSFVQAILICALAIYVLKYDDELASGQSADWRGRLFGYSGAAGFVQAMAAGYFLWDVWVSTVDFRIHGPGSLAHAISALAVTTIGFRPFANYYGLVFILYELSTPFLNIHWFLDKLQMTGSKAQLYNGIVLLVTFGSCRLIWGTYQSYRIYSDLWNAVAKVHMDPADAVRAGRAGDLVKGLQYDEDIPTVLAISYLASNTLLVFLNFYWFNAMIAAVTKRFKKPGDKKQ